VNSGNPLDPSARVGADVSMALGIISVAEGNAGELMAVVSKPQEQSSASLTRKYKAFLVPQASKQSCKTRGVLEDGEAAKCVGRLTIDGLKRLLFAFGT